jgi:uncharacterized membrane protein
VIEHRAAFWQGPIPPPAVLREFGEIVPDAPERILRQWENESEHRRRMEHGALEAHHKRSVQGLWNAIVFALGSLITSNVALVLHEPQAAMVLGGGTIASVVAIFIYQRRAPSVARSANEAKPKTNLPGRPR